jgi:allantoicase
LKYRIQDLTTELKALASTLEYLEDEFTEEVKAEVKTETENIDTEKQKQEELNEAKKKDVSKVEEFTFTDDDGNITYVQIRIYPDGKRMAYQGIEKINMVMLMIIRHLK